MDGLLPFPGLWSALQIGSLRRVLTLRCPEVNSTYRPLYLSTDAKTGIDELSCPRQTRLAMDLQRRPQHTRGC